MKQDNGAVGGLQSYIQTAEAEKPARSDEGIRERRGSAKQREREEAKFVTSTDGI